MAKSNKKLSERISEAVEAYGKPADVARALGVSKAAVSNWLSGATREIKAANLLELAKISGFSPDYIQYGILPRLQSEVAEQRAFYALESDVDRALYDLLKELPTKDRAKVLKYGQSGLSEVPITELLDELKRRSGE